MKRALYTHADIVNALDDWYCENAGGPGPHGSSLFDEDTTWADAVSAAVVDDDHFCVECLQEPTSDDAYPYCSQDCQANAAERQDQNRHEGI